MHKRTLIKNKVLELVSASSIELNNAVYSNSVEKIKDEKLPFANISTDGETSEIHGTSPRSYKKTFRYTVEVFSKNKNLEAELDVISGKIEDALTSNETLDGIVVDTIFTNVDYTFDYDGRYFLSSCKLSFESIYEQDVTYPTVVDDLLENKVEYSLSEESNSTFDTVNLG